MTDPGRTRWLDVLRGIALLGILPVNAPFFSEPITTAPDPLRFSWRPVADVVAAHGVMFFGQYKFITLFSLLFGAGIMLLRQRAEATGRPFHAWMVRRLLVLGVVGIAHAWFLWYGDILFYYAVLGLALFWGSAWKPRTQLVVGAVLVAAPLGLLALFTVVAAAFGGFGGPPEADAAEMVAAAHGPWEEFLQALATMHPAFEAEVYRSGSFARITVLRALTWLMGLFSFGLYFMPRVGGLFLIGMAAVKSGWFTAPADHRRVFRSMLVVGGTLGVVIQLPSIGLLGFFAEDHPVGLLGEACVYVGSLGLAAAIAGGVALLCLPAPPRWTYPFEAVGRTAFTNYLMQSVIAAGVYQAWGLGLFGSVGRARGLALVLGIWIFQLALSSVWLAFFRIGPLEWVWRSLTYAHPQRIRARVSGPHGAESP